jgi:4-amino-4-deoxy-L-arabinose transferase-like glycosyltransferase
MVIDPSSTAHEPGPAVSPAESVVEDGAEAAARADVLVQADRRARAGLQFAGLGLLILGQFSFDRDVGFSPAAGLTSAGGLGLILWSLLLARRPAPARHPMGLRLGYGAAGLLYAVAASALAGELAVARHPGLALLTWGMAMMMGWVACRRRDDPTAAQPPPWTRREVVGLAALVGLALLLRVLGATRLPALTSDEAAAGLSAVDILQGRLSNPFVMGWYSFPALFYSLPAAAIGFLGQNYQALRLPAAIAGALSVVGVYWFGRNLYGRQAASYAAILLAGMNFHLHFSRIGLNNIWDAVFATFVLGSFWHGWRYERRRSFVVAGLLLGLSQYFYTGSRLLPLVLLAWVALVALVDRPAIRRHAGDLATVALMALIVVLPLAMFYAGHPGEFDAPSSRVSLLHDPDGGGHAFERLSRETGTPVWQLVLANYAQSASVFTATPLRHWYQSGYPMLLTLPAALFLAGLAEMLVQFRDRRHWLLALWLAGIISVGALTESAPAAQRYIGAAPLAALVCGLGLAVIVELIVALWPGWRRAAPAAALGFVLVAAVIDTHFYFFEYGRERAFGDVGMETAATLGRELATYPPHSIAYFFGLPAMGYRTQEIMSFMAPQVTGEDVQYPPLTQRWPPARGRTVFVFLLERIAEADAVQRCFPGGQRREFTGHDGRLLFMMYSLPQSSAPP